MEDALRIPAEETPAGRALVATPRVSVLFLAYRHEPWLRQSLDSVLAQEGPFSYEILIGEDCSPDGTRAICQEYQQRLPDRVRLVTSAANVGMHRNLLRLWVRARGEFVALLEGDDYWTDPGKLAKQVRLMEGHPECSFCGARTENLRFRLGRVQTSYGLEDVLVTYPFHTSTALFRGVLLDAFPETFLRVKALDSCLYVLYGQKGRCGFLDATVSYYRRQGGGAWSGLTLLRQYEEIVRFTDTVAAHVGGDSRQRLLVREFSLCRDLTESLLDGDRDVSLGECRPLVSAAWPRLRSAFPLKAALWACRALSVPVLRRCRRARRRLALRSRLRCLLGATGGPDGGEGTAHG